MPASFGVSSNPFGDYTGWELQSVSAPAASERAQAFGSQSNEEQSELYDKRISYTATYKAARNYAAVAPSLPTHIGASIADSGNEPIILTSISVSPVNNDMASMTLSGHQHVDGTDGTALQSVAHGITMTKGFGANLFGVGLGTADSILNSSVTIECDHVETKDADGDTAQGENFNPRISISVTSIGKGTTAPSGYDVISRTPDESNTEFETESVEYYKALAFPFGS
jgi:hypothetical protein